MPKKKLTFFENRCEIKGREEQHDPMIMAWHYKSSKVEPLAPLPAKRERKPFANDEKQTNSGAPEHADCAPPPARRGNFVSRWWRKHSGSQPLLPPGFDQNDSGEHADEKEQEPKPFAQEEEQTNSGAPEHADPAPLSLPPNTGDVFEEADYADATEQEPDYADATEQEPEEEEQDNAEDSADEIRSIGFALANSAALLPEFALPQQAKNCIDSASIDTMRNACSQEEVKAFSLCMERFF